MMQATKVSRRRSQASESADHLVELADALRTVVLAVRRKSAGSAQDKSIIALLAHLKLVGPLRAADLAEHACLDPSTVSRHLRALEADGLLMRTPDPDDGRATQLQVTSKGERIVDEARGQRLAMLGSALEDWSEKDIATLTRLTRRLAESMERL
jgi:DNA-binding MarR family transcriptional regulator